MGNLPLKRHENEELAYGHDSDLKGPPTAAAGQHPGRHALCVQSVNDSKWPTCNTHIGLPAALTFTF